MNIKLNKENDELNINISCDIEYYNLYNIIYFECVEERRKN